MIDPPEVEVVLTHATIVKAAGEVNELAVPTNEPAAPSKEIPVDVNPELTGEVNGMP
jgi:hypothetical protein